MYRSNFLKFKFIPAHNQLLRNKVALIPLRATFTCEVNFHEFTLRTAEHIFIQTKFTERRVNCGEKEQSGCKQTQTLSLPAGAQNGLAFVFGGLAVRRRIIYRQITCCLHLCALHRVGITVRDIVITAPGPMGAREPKQSAHSVHNYICKQRSRKDTPNLSTRHKKAFAQFLCEDAKHWICKRFSIFA